jgi:putative sporulation protein YtaF
MHGLQLVPILLIAISSNADNLVVGIAYGIRNIRVTLPSNLFIAVFTGAVTLSSMLAGQRIGSYMPPQLASLLGGGIIAGIGAWVLVQSALSSASGSERPAARSETASSLSRLLSVLKDPAIADRDCSGHIDLKEVCLLAVALSLNNVGNGIGAGMVGINPALTTIAVIPVSVIMLWAGLSAGHYGQRMLGGFARVVSGVLLVAVGVYEIRL